MIVCFSNGDIQVELMLCSYFCNALFIDLLLFLEGLILRIFIVGVVFKMFVFKIRIVSVSAFLA